MLLQKLCKHCHQPITHSTHNLTQYCNRHDCIADRSNNAVKNNRRKAGTANRRCKFCGKTVDVPIDTPKGHAVCPICKSKGYKATDKVPKAEKCRCCNSRPIATELGLRMLCYECWSTDGNYDAELGRTGHRQL